MPFSHTQVLFHVKIVHLYLFTGCHQKREGFELITFLHLFCTVISTIYLCFKGKFWILQPNGEAAVYYAAFEIFWYYFIEIFLGHGEIIVCCTFVFMFALCYLFFTFCLLTLATCNVICDKARKFQARLYLSCYIDWYG